MRVIGKLRISPIMSTSVIIEVRHICILFGAPGVVPGAMPGEQGCGYNA